LSYTSSKRKALPSAGKQTARARTPNSPRARMNSRRQFLKATSGGALLSLTPLVSSGQSAPASTEMRTLFFDLSHEHHQGHRYYFVAGKQRHQLQPCNGFHPALLQARLENSVIRMLPDSALTHVVEGIQLPPAVQFSYLMKDPDTSTGTYGVSAMYLLPPKSSFAYAYEQARKKLQPGQPLRLSAKRKKYGLAPASTLQDLVDEQDVIDTTQWATTLANLHPELLSADPNSAAHIQTNHIQTSDSTTTLAQVLAFAGPAVPAQSLTLDNKTGWATLVPYTEDDQKTPIKATTGHNKGLILYDTKWQPAINVPYISDVMTVASNGVKNDTTLGVDVTPDRGSLSTGDLTGTIWCRNDGVTSISQDATAPDANPANAKFTLSNVTPNYNGYSVVLSTANSGNGYQINLQYKNWYLRWLGLFIQFLDSDDNVLPASDFPDIGSDPFFNTKNNELCVGFLTPEFTIFGIPTQPSGNTVQFTFPAKASRAKILASGLGFGSHTYPDTELLGVMMTSIFNLSLPAFLMALGVAAELDVILKAVIIPFGTLIVQTLFTDFEDFTLAQIGTIFWRAVVRGLVAPGGPLKPFLEAFGKYFLLAEITDNIPLIGAILQAFGALVAIAEIDETACEVILSPWTYEYDLVATYNLQFSVSPDPDDHSGFPASAVSYLVTAIFDNGTPHVQQGTIDHSKPTDKINLQFTGVPLGGNVTLTAAVYESDGTQVGHGTTGAIANSPPPDKSAIPGITIKEKRLPVQGVTYQHDVKTTIDAQGNHSWACAPAPLPPVNSSACQPAPGNICSYRGITYNNSLDYVGYVWQSYNENACNPGGVGQLDQLANIPGVNGSNGNAQNGYATIPCSLQGAALMAYDPLGRLDVNYYVDTTNNINMLRQVQLKNNPPFADPRSRESWGKFNLPPDDILIHPAGTIITINTGTSRLESLKIPAAALSDADAAVSLQATLHGGQGDRPGLFNSPTAATITSDGVILVVEQGNNRIHALDASANPVPLFSKQPQKYFLVLEATGGPGTQYLDIAAEFSGYIYVLSYSNSIYRLDVYDPNRADSTPISTTMGFNAAKVTVDYWRNVYSLNYEVLKTDGQLPPNKMTEPSISRWLPTTSPCDTLVPANPSGGATGHGPGKSVKSPVRLLRRDFWRIQNSRV